VTIIANVSSLPRGFLSFLCASNDVAILPYSFSGQISLLNVNVILNQEIPG
jgi:hypothetical protein